MTNKEQNTTPPQSDGTACPVTDDRKEWLLRLKSQDAEIQKLREALGVAGEEMSDNIPSQRGPNFDWKREAEHYQAECDKLRDLIRKVEAENAQLKAERAAEIVSNTRTIMSGTAVMRENTALRSALEVAREALVGIAAEHLSFPDAPTSWTKEELLEVVCTDTDIARETLAAIDAVLQGSSGEKV